MYCCSAKLINLYRNENGIDAAAGYNDPATNTGISDLLDYGARGGGAVDYPSVNADTGEGNVTSEWVNNQPGMERVRLYFQTLPFAAGFSYPGRLLGDARI